MSVSGGSFLNSVVDLTALAIIILVLYRLRRQKIPQYRDAKVLLLMTDAILAIVIVIDMLSNYILENSYLNFDSIAEPALVFIDAILLMSFSYFIYVRSPEKRFLQRLKSFLTKNAFPHGIIITSLGIYTVSLDAYLISARPFQLTTLPNFAGGGVTITTLYSNLTIELFLPVMLVFLIYSSVGLFLVARRLADRVARQGMFLLMLGLLAIGPALICFNVLAETLGYETAPIGFLVIAIAFIPSSTIFKGASALAAFFGPIKNLIPQTLRFTNRLKGDESLRGEVTLMQFDHVVKYEDVIKDFVMEQISLATPTYIFTSRGSPIHNVLAKIPEARFFLLTDAVSYSRTGDGVTEMLLPRNNQAVILDVIERTISSNSGESVALVYDSISDMILYDGVEKTYKFLKHVNEMLGERKVTAIFLIAPSVDNTAMKLVMSLFLKQLLLDRSGLRLT